MPTPSETPAPKPPDAGWPLPRLPARTGPAPPTRRAWLIGRLALAMRRAVVAAEEDG